MKERNYLLKRKHVKTRAWEELTRITVISSCKLNIKFITQSALSLSLSQFSPDQTRRRMRTISVSELPR